MDNITASTDFFSYYFAFDQTNGTTRDSSSNITGTLEFSNNIAYSRVSSHTASPVAADNIISETTILQSGNTDDLTGDVIPAGSKTKTIYGKCKFYPAKQVAYSWKDASHFTSGSSSQSFLDFFGRVVVKDTFIIKGGFDAVANLTDEAGGNVFLEDSTTWRQLKYAGMYWPADPTILLCGTDANSLNYAFTAKDTAGTGETNKRNASLERVGMDSVGTNLQWFDSVLNGGSNEAAAADEIGGADCIANAENSFGVTGIPMLDIASSNIGNSTDSSKYSGGDLGYLDKKLNGTNVIRANNFFRNTGADASGGVHMDWSPRHNLARVPDASGGGDHIRVAKPWNFFISDTARLNTSAARYECYIPINLLSDGDSRMHLIDVSLVKQVGTCSGTTWTYAALPGNGGTESYRMAPMKAFPDATTYNAKVTATKSNADFVTMSGSMVTSSDSYIWSIVEGSLGMYDAGYTGEASSIASRAKWTYSGGGSSSVFHSMTLASDNPELIAFYRLAADFDGSTYSVYGTGNNLITAAGFSTAARFDTNIIQAGSGEDMNLFSTEDSVFSKLVTAGQGEKLPHVFFAVKKSDVDAQGLTEGYFYNRVRIRYTREVKSDAVVTTQNRLTSDILPNLKGIKEMPIYEAYCLIKIKLEAVSGTLSVHDLEGDTAVDGSQIDFGTLLA
jgi:hypothetical protein